MDYSSLATIHKPENNRQSPFTKRKILLLLGVLLLIGMSSAATFYLFKRSTSTFAAHTLSTKTTQHNISTSNNTTVVGTVTPLPSYISGQPTSSISYSLTTKPFGWEGSIGNSKAPCSFQRDGYHISSDNYFYQCLENNTILSNFILQVQMHLGGDLQGGGILFRYSYEKGTDLITLYSDGTYQMHKSNNISSSPLNGTSPLFQSVPPTKGNSYLLAIVASGSSITFYVNKQKIATATDNTYSKGWIGLKVDGEGQKANEAIFTNLTIWTLPDSLTT